MSQENALPQDSKLEQEHQLTLEYGHVHFEEHSASQIDRLFRAIGHKVRCREMVNVEPTLHQHTLLQIQLFTMWRESRLFLVEIDATAPIPDEISRKEHTPGQAYIANKAMYISCAENTWLPVTKVKVVHRRPLTIPRLCKRLPFR